MVVSLWGTGLISGAQVIHLLQGRSHVLSVARRAPVFFHQHNLFHMGVVQRPIPRSLFCRVQGKHTMAQLVMLSLSPKAEKRVT